MDKSPAMPAANDNVLSTTAVPAMRKRFATFKPP